MTTAVMQTVIEGTAQSSNTLAIAGSRKITAPTRVAGKWSSNSPPVRRPTIDVMPISVAICAAVVRLTPISVSIGTRWNRRAVVTSTMSSEIETSLKKTGYRISSRELRHGDGGEARAGCYAGALSSEVRNFQKTKGKTMTSHIAARPM